RHYYERFSETKSQLSSQNMEEIGRCGTVGHNHIFIRTQSEESLKARRRMFSPLPFRTMRKQHNEAVLNFPFFFGCCQILIYNNLCTVHEIPKLCFPNGKRIRRCHSITVIKS